MPRRTHRPTLPEWQSSRPFQSQQDQIQGAPPQSVAAPSNQGVQLPRHILARALPFFSAQSRLRPPISVTAAADIGALDSNVQAVGQLRIQRRTDIRIIRVWRKEPEPEPSPVIDLDAARRFAIVRMRNMRLEALWLSGAITDDEYFALRLAA